MVLALKIEPLKWLKALKRLGFVERDWRDSSASPKAEKLDI
jgi:hypothetical protein